MATQRWTYQRFREAKLNFSHVKDKREALRLIDAVREYAPAQMAVDLETTRQSIRLIQLGFESEQGRARQLVFDCAHLPGVLVRPLLEDPAIEKLIHHSQFEQNWCAKHLGCVMDNVFDTCIAWQLIQDRLALRLAQGGREALAGIYPSWQPHPNKLDVLCRLALGFELPKEEQNSAWARPHLSRAQLTYAAMDVAVLFALTARTRPMLDRLDLTAQMYSKSGLVAQRAAARHLAAA